MTTIWKYALDPSHPVITTPRHSKVLTAAAQGDDICVWVMVESENPADEQHHFDVFGTGHRIPEGVRVFIGTAFLGPLVFHVFERNPVIDI